MKTQHEKFLDQAQAVVNRERAKKAKRALVVGYDAGESTLNQVEMILIDLLHLCERDGIMVVPTLAKAQRVYHSEGGLAVFRVMDADQTGTAIDAIDEELNRLDDTGEVDYTPEDLKAKKEKLLALMQKLE